MKLRRNLFLTSLLAFSMPHVALAATGTWTGSTGGTWDTSATNWTGVTGTPWDSTNGATNDAVFNLASLAATVSGTVHTNGITFSTTGGLSGGIITLAGTTPGISVAASQIGTIGSAISGSAGLRKTSAGTLILSGSNNYTGGTAINAGTVQVNTGGTLGSTSGVLSMGTGAPFVTGTVGNLTVNANTQVGAFSVQSNTSNTTTSTNIGQLSIASGRTLTVSSLAVGVSQGANNVAINTALGTGSSNVGTLTVTGGVTVGLSTSGTGNRAITVADLSGLANFNAGSGSGDFRVGYGMLNRATMTLASTANVINVATISVGETVSSGNSAENNILNLGTGTNALQVNTIQTGTQKASGVIQFAHATNGSVVITGAGGTGVSNIFVGNQNGSGSYQAGNLNNRLLLAGHTATVSAGTVNIARRTGTGAGNAVISELTFDTGTFTTTGNITLAQVAAVASAANATGTFTLGTTSANTGELTVGTSGTPRDFVLSDNRSTSTSATNGSFIINGGTATIHGNIVNTSTTTTGTSTTTLTLDGGTLDMTNGNIGGDGTSGNRAITNLNFRSGTLKNVAQINNGAGLTKTTAGTLVLEGTNTYTGGTNINEGTLEIRHANALGTTGTIAFGGGTLQYGTGITTDLSSRFSTAASQAYKINTNGNDVAVATALSSTGGNLTKDGAGTLTLNANSTYTGDTLVNNGTLALSSTGGLKFVIGADDVNNKITGTGAGTITLDGLFTFDLTTASTILNDSWNIVDVANLTESFGSNFNVDTFTKEGGGTGAGIWTKAIDLTTYSYQFNTASGVLTVIPEPSAALLGGLGLLALLRRRR